MVRRPDCFHGPLTRRRPARGSLGLLVVGRLLRYGQAARLVGEDGGVVVPEVGLGHEKGQARQVVGAGVVLHAQFLGQPCLVVGQRLQFRSAGRHDASPVARGRCVDDVDTQGVDAVAQAIVELLWRELLLTQVIHVEGEETRGRGVGVGALLSAESGLPADCGKLSLQIGTPAGDLLAERGDMRTADDGLKLLAGEQRRDGSQIFLKIKLHFFKVI